VKSGAGGVSGRFTPLDKVLYLTGLRRGGRNSGGKVVLINRREI